MKKKEDILESITDEKLVIFLQTNCPTPPKELISCEDLIVKAILNEKQEFPKNKQWRWLAFSTAIITGILVISTQVFKPNFTLQTASEQDEEIEAFMINSWQGSMALSE